MTVLLAFLLCALCVLCGEIFGLMWAIALASLVGTVANILQKRWCFGVWAVTNSVWTVYDITLGAWPQAALMFTYFCLAIWGLIAPQWKKKPQPATDADRDYIAKFALHCGAGGRDNDVRGAEFCVGHVVCSICHHRWIAVRPADTVCSLECPECGNFTGQEELDDPAR